MSERKSKAGAPKPAAPKAEVAKAAAPKAAAKAAPASKAEPKAAAPKAAEPKAAKPVEAKPAAKAAPAAAPAAEGGRKTSFKRTLIGLVKSDKMDKTVVVEVVRSKMDPVYKKYVRVRKSYQAHDEQNNCKIGDRVEIIEHRPLSKMKRWKVVNLLERAVQE